MALEKPRKLGEFFLLLCGHPVVVIGVAAAAEVISINLTIRVVRQGQSQHAELPEQPQPEPVDKWSFLRNPSVSVPALDDIVTKILRDDSTDIELPTAAPIGHEAGDVMRHADQWDYAELSDISAKSQSCTSDVFSFDGYENVLFLVAELYVFMPVFVLRPCVCVPKR